MGGTTHQPRIRIKSFECPKSKRNYGKINVWNIRQLVDELFVPSTQWASVLYWRLSDYQNRWGRFGHGSSGFFYGLQGIDIMVSREYYVGWPSFVAGLEYYSVFFVRKIWLRCIHESWTKLELWKDNPASKEEFSTIYLFTEQGTSDFWRFRIVPNLFLIGLSDPHNHLESIW